MEKPAPFDVSVLDRGDYLLNVGADGVQIRPARCVADDYAELTLKIQALREENEKLRSIARWLAAIDKP